MRKIKIFAALSAAIVLLGSCAKDIDSEMGGIKRVPYHFTAYLDSATKTELGDDDRPIWKAGDEVLFFTSDSTPEQAQVKTVAADGPVAEFDVEALEFVNAVYGATVLETGIHGLRLRNVVKEHQDGSFGNAHVSVAHKEDLENKDLVFSNLTSMLRFKVNRDDVAYVRVYRKSKAPLGGDVMVYFDATTGYPSASFNGDNPIESIRVDTKDKDGYFYVALLPGTYKGGIEVRCFNSSNNRIASAASKNDFTLSKNKILDMGVLDEHFAPDPVDLSTILGESITANCYIAPGHGEYKFPVVFKGNSKSEYTCLDHPAAVDVLWETYGTNDSIQPGSVVDDVSYTKGYVYLTTIHDGSAIIAIRDESGKILWSWHIWVWDGYEIMDAAQKYYNDAGSMMDRNLGAASAAIGDNGSCGFLYQWGRKDPFLGAYTYAKSAETISEKHILVPMSATTTVYYAAANPMSFIYSTDTGGDWLPERNDDLWGKTKSMYDPCPPGWKVPDADFWYKAMKNMTGITKNYDRTNLGINFVGDNNGYNMGNGSESNGVIWYPATGYRDGKATVSTVSWIQWYGFWWSSGVGGDTGLPIDPNNKNTRDDNLAYYFSMLGTENSIQTMVTSMRASGLNVRCQLDYTPKPVEVQSIELDKSSITLKRYGSEQLTVTVKPSYAANTEVKWETTNPNVADVTQNGLVTGVGEGDCTITVSSKAKPNLKAVCSVHVDKDQENLLAPANCFVVDKPGQYRFDATIKGNGSGNQTAMEPVFVRVLWTTYGDATTPYLPVVDNLVLDREANTIAFDVPSPMQNGNAVIATLGSTGEILWSWHIWSCAGFDPEATAQVYNYVTEVIEYEKDAQGNDTNIPVKDSNGNPKIKERIRTDGPTLMDRNLGATSITKGDVHSLGLLYQWGRKDPFVGPQTISSSTSAAVSGTVQSNVTSNAIVGTIDYSVKNPATYISGDEANNYDWLNVTDNTLWGAGGSKTIYDPCPAGWRVPSGGENGVFARAFMPKAGEEGNKTGVSVTHTWDTVYRGMDLSGEFGSGNIWYPFAAYRTRTGGNIAGQNQYSRLWTSSYATSGRNNGYAMFLSYGQGGVGTILLNTTWNKSFAASVRCVKE